MRRKTPAPLCGGCGFLFRFVLRLKGADYFYGGCLWFLFCFFFWNISSAEHYEYQIVSEKYRYRTVNFNTMHDPSTLAFEIRYPWREYKKWPKSWLKKMDCDWRSKDIWETMSAAEQLGRSSMRPNGYRNSFISIWHEDPERDGSDDSCGWAYPKLTSKQKERLWNAAWGESKYPHFLVMNGKEWEGTYTEAVSLYTGMILVVVQVLDLNISLEKIQRKAISRIHHPDCCPAVNVFCYQPGYHTNNKNDTERNRQEHFYGILCGIARGLLSDLRPWYLHPRWHFWHWRFQIHPWQQFRRWAFDRCCKCGKGFKWNESVIADWNGTKIWHDKCDSTEIKPTL